MATAAQRTALLSITCPWCQVGPGQVCVRGRHASIDQEGGLRRKRPQPVTVLDGGCHDARWQAAGLGTAPVVTERLRELHPVGAAPQRAAEPAPDDDRPW